MCEEISIMFDENGIAKEYDDTFDITIHCESEEEQNRVLEILNRQWIPVSEGLPEDNEIKLVTCKTKTGIYNVNRAYYSHGSGGSWHGSGSMAGVIAWMNLPEPYKED